MFSTTRALYRISRAQLVSSPRPDVFAFFANPANLEQLTPAFLNFRILTPMPIAMGIGTRIDYAITLFGLPMRWRTHIAEWEPGVSFLDEQEAGPYAIWRHTHEFESQGEHTWIRDRVDYALPFGPLGRLTHALVVNRTLKRIFDYRREAASHIFGRVSERDKVALGR
jgi:ligand-binding SRPBCC domain-containing protein